MTIGQRYDPDTYNCVDFAWELLGPTAPDVSQCKTVPGFFRTLRKHWQRASWPPAENDLVVMVSCRQWHLGVWRSGRVWHCLDQAQATDYGTIKAMYPRVEFYRHVSDNRQTLRRPDPAANN